MSAEESNKKNPITVRREPDGSIVFSGTSPDIVRDKNRALSPFGYQLRCFGLRFMLLPSKEQQSMLNKTIGCARVVHNDYIACKQEAYKHGESLSLSDYKKHRLKELKKEKPFLKEVEAHSLEFAAKHANSAFQNFFTGKSKYPRFASRNKPNGNRYESSFPKNGVTEENGAVYVYLPKIGKIKGILPGKKSLDDLLPHGADITGATVSRTADRYYISLHVSLPVPEEKPSTVIRASRVCAVDMGVKSFVTVGVGVGNPAEKVENPKWVTKQEKKIRRLMRSLSRKKKGSKNREKARRKLAKAQNKIANQRKDYQHKLSKSLVDRCDAFICEDLDINGLVKNHKLAREISSAGWGLFLDKVRYKMQWKGGIFIKVDRFFPSSKRCHHCGYHYQELSLKERTWECPQCHTLHDRDGNAVQNLLQEGVRLLEEQGVAVVHEDPMPGVG